MTGMKSGAGDDPFADAEEETTNDEADEESEDEDASSSEQPEVKSESTKGEPTAGVGRTPESGTAAGSASGDDHGSTSESDQKTSTDRMTVEELPYIARRNVRGESVKKGRDKNVLFELRPEIADSEDEFVAELERRLETDVPKTDAREAALAAIWDRPELVVPILEEWGLGYFEDRD